MKGIHWTAASTSGGCGDRVASISRGCPKRVTKLARGWRGLGSLRLRIPARTRAGRLVPRHTERERERERESVAYRQLTNEQLTQLIKSYRVTEPTRHTAAHPHIMGNATFFFAIYTPNLDRVVPRATIDGTSNLAVTVHWWVKGMILVWSACFFFSF